jgi:hypothetical protein
VGSSLDAFWVVGGRLVDWGPVAADPEPAELERRTAAALARGERGPGVGTHLPPDEVDEMRIVAAYLASHPDTPELVLDPAPGAAHLEKFVRDAIAEPRVRDLVRHIDVLDAEAEASG